MGINQVFFSLMPGNIMKMALVDFLKDSTSISVVSTFETSIIDIASNFKSKRAILSKNDVDFIKVVV